MKWLRLVIINLVVLFCLLGMLEIAARVYVAYTRGTQTAGVQERTVYLSYEPFVMYGPGWDEGLAPSRWPKTSAACRVLLVGGSTAAGFPGDILRHWLQRRAPGRSFEVVNAAQGGYEARQEVVVTALWEPDFSLTCCSLWTVQTISSTGCA